MANVYDPETEEERDFSPRSSDSLDDVRNAESGGQSRTSRGTTSPAGGGSFRFNPDGDRKGRSSAVSSSSLRDNEESVAGLGDAANERTDVAGLGGIAQGQNEEGSRSSKAKSAYNFLNTSPLQRLIGRARGSVSNKWLIGIGFGSGIFIIILLVMLLIFLGNYKIVQLAQEIADYQFARVARNYSENVSQITAEDTELSTADQSTLQQAFSKLGDAKDGSWGAMWDKINQYRPDQIVQNFKEDGTLDFKYESTGASSLWKKKLTAVYVNGQEITPANASLWDRYVHPVQTYQANVAFSDELDSKLAQAMNGRSAIIRGAVAANIRNELGVKLFWWDKLSSYTGASQEEANALIEAQSEQKINFGIKPSPTEVGQIAQGAQDTQDAITQCTQNDGCLAEEVKNGGQLPSGAVSAIDSAVSSDVFQKAVSFVNPTYAVSLPVCLIYDGSLSNSGSGQSQTVDNVSKQDQRTFYAVETASDQQKNGSKINGEAAGAMDWKIGQVEKSIPGERASGASPTTNGELHPESNADGTLGNTTSIFSFLPVGGSLADSVASASCPLVTNLWFGGGVGVASLIAGFFSGGTSEIAEQGLGRALASYMADFAGELFTKKEAVKLGIYVAGTEGATLFAKMLVAQKAAANDNGLPVGVPFDNAADRGGNLNAQETSQKFYGRPLTNAEVAESSVSDQNYRANEVANEGFSERYFALSNPESLLSQFGTTLSTHLNGTIFSSIANLGSRVLNPTSSFATMFSGFNKQTAMAQDAADNKNYGNVQWGFSDDEWDYIKTHKDFSPIENMSVVENSTYNGQPISDYIDSKYGKCWTESMGQLLTDGSIQRNNNGDITGGLCSKQNISYNSADSATYDPVTNNNDLVLRYRLMKSEEETIDQLINYQTVTPDDPGSTSGSTGSTADPTADSGPSTVSGNAQQIAQQILQQAKAGKIQFNVLDSSDESDGSTPEDNIKETANGQPAKTTTTCASAGRGATPPNATVDLNIDLLKFILQLSQKENIQINAIAGQCHSSSSSNHYQGKAVDFGCPFDPGPADAVGKSYNIFDGTGETCGTSPPHYHYSVGGN
jgi:hypothetical protein